MGRTLRGGALPDSPETRFGRRVKDAKRSRFPPSQTDSPARPRRLPRRFERDGHILRLVVRSDSAALYAQSVAGRVVAYEVYRVRVCPAVVLKGRRYPCREVLPRDEHWGSYAWTFVSLADARAKYRTIGERRP